MYRIDDNQNVAELPADPTDNVGTPGYFTGGNPSSGIPATRVRYWWLNMIQEELCAIVEQNGLTLAKDNRGQVLTAIRSMFRTRVVGGTLTFYVSTTGSDSNDGLSSEAPLATIQQALNLAAENYDLTGTTVQISLAAGSYSGPIISGSFIRAPIVLAGAGSTTTTVTSATAHSIQVLNGGQLTLQGLTITNSSANSGDYTGGTAGLIAQNGGLAFIGSDITFGSCPNGAHLWAYQGGVITALSQSNGQGRNYTITGGAKIHMYASSTGDIVLSDCTVTLTGAPGFPSGFANAAQSGSIGCWNNVYSGSATGYRYSVSSCGTINTQGQSSSYLPGNTTGLQSTGGQIV